ncbi:MAG: thiamine diphosphokinase, partial [Chloroflexia bacterium]
QARPTHVQPTVRCIWVLSGAPLPAEPPDVSRLPRPDRVVAADGGQGLAELLGLDPDLVVGDLDSIDPASLARLETEHVAIERYEHHLKSETDTELAALAALRWQPERIIILGAVGGRLDHTLANILLLTNPAFRDVHVSIADGAQELFLAKPSRWTVVRGEPGDTMSLLPLGEPATGITLEGFEYPLSDETLTAGSGRGVSNRLAGAEGRIWLGGGQLLVVVCRKT